MIELFLGLRILSPFVYKKVSEVFGLDIRELGSYKLGRKEGLEEERKKGTINLILIYLEDHFEFRREELEKIRKLLDKIENEEKLKSIFKKITHKNNIKEIRVLFGLTT